MASMTCDTCGAMVDPETSDDFCPSCGEPLVAATAVVVPTGTGDPGRAPAAARAPQDCPYCGAEVLNPANRACTDCLRPFPDRVPDAPLAPPTRPVPVGGSGTGPAPRVAGTRRDGGGAMSLTFTAGGAELGRLEVGAHEDLVVGRLPGLPAAALIEKWDNVSRRHARIGVDADGTCWVSDENSTNGTLLNGAPVRPGARETVRDGDSLRFGADVTVTVTRRPGR